MRVKSALFFILSLARIFHSEASQKLRCPERLFNVFVEFAGLVCSVSPLNLLKTVRVF